MVILDIMSKKAFLRFFGAAMKNAGYLCGTSINSIRQYLGKKLDGESQYLSTSLRMPVKSVSSRLASAPSTPSTGVFSAACDWKKSSHKMAFVGDVSAMSKPPKNKM
jgi:hypothetical protein